MTGNRSLGGMRPTMSTPRNPVGWFEIYVTDMARARAFYEAALGLSPMFADERLTAYPVGGRSALLLFRRGSTT